MMEDGTIKSPPVGEGVAYFIVKFVLQQLHMDIDLLNYAKDVGLNYPQSNDPREIQQFEHGGAFMFWWALLASCVAKLTYFNSAFTIIRASEIFTDLNPAFNNGMHVHICFYTIFKWPKMDSKYCFDFVFTLEDENDTAIREQNVQEQADSRDSELSIQFQQEQGNVM